MTRSHAPACVRIAGAAGLILAAALSAASPVRAEFPQTGGSFTRNVGTVAGRERSFFIYVPKQLKPGAPLLFVFHGGGGDAGIAREGTGRGFEVLADRYGFVIAYPDGISRSWNNCRKEPASAAKRMKVDDLAFVDAMIAQAAAQHRIDVKRVFAAGHSNGGALAYRLAMERPSAFAGIAAISSNLPSPDNMDCKPLGAPMPVLIMNGTADPVSPYEGGRRMRNDRFVGGALSTDETAQYWRNVNGLPEQAETMRLPHVNPSDRTSVDRVSWTAPGKPPVVLYTINNGGHVVPQPYWRFPRQVGAQTQDVDATEAIWDFFTKMTIQGSP